MSVATTVAVGAALGTGAPLAATLGSNSTDSSGVINLTAGSTSPTTGVLCTLTLTGNYSSGVDGPGAVRMTFTQVGAAAALLGVFVSAVTGRVVTLNCTTAPTASTAYVINYHIDTSGV
jgi:hypothetical protein